jgi:adenylyltransferase/sulfurtransferase
VGTNKAISARRAMLDLNPTLSCTALAIAIDADNVLELASRHDVIVDACDNPRTRYLLNDACILAGKPLVSGSAMGTEGQLTVYNYRSPIAASDEAIKRTACYRCLYPKPVVAEGCKSCSDNGVLGMVPGVVGILQAVEVIKVATGIGSIMHDRLMMYDSLHCSFINVKKPPARPNCAVCSPDATIRNMLDSDRSLDNVRGPSICALPTPEGMSLTVDQSVSCAEYNELLSKGQPHVLLDVRVARQYEMCSLKGSINLPLEQLESQLERVGLMSRGELPIYCICRRGIASEEATSIIQQSIKDGNAVHSVYNIQGGLNSWAKTVDSEFPQY